MGVGECAWGCRRRQEQGKTGGGEGREKDGSEGRCGSASGLVHGEGVLAERNTIRSKFSASSSDPGSICRKMHGLYQEFATQVEKAKTDLSGAFRRDGVEKAGLIGQAIDETKKQGFRDRLTAMVQRVGNIGQRFENVLGVADGDGGFPSGGFRKDLSDMRNGVFLWASTI